MMWEATKVWFLCLLVAFAFAGDGWTKYLSDAQNTGSTSLAGPVGELCSSFNTTNSFYAPLLTPPVLSDSQYLYTASSNVSVTYLQKTEVLSPAIIWTAEISFQFRTHMALDPRNTTWAGSDRCNLISVRDNGASYDVQTLQLNKNCSVPFTGGISLSGDGSIAVTRDVEGNYYGVSTTSADLTSADILWQNSLPFGQIGFNDDYGTLLIDPKNHFKAWGVINNSLFSLNLQTGEFTAETLLFDLGSDLIVSSLVNDADTSRTYFTTIGNVVYCFSLSSGELLWKSGTSESTFYHRPSTPALSSSYNILYVVMSYTLYAFDSAEGSLLYSWALEEERNMPLYISVDIDDHVYFTSETYLYGFDGSTGETVYRNNTLELAYLDTSVTVVGNFTLALQSGSQFILLTDNDNVCIAEEDSSSSSEGDLFIWIVTSMISFVIVVFTILAAAECIGKFKKRKYSEIE